MNIYINPTGCKHLVKVSLPEPREGKLTGYLYDEENICLYELHRHLDPSRSWFADNSFGQQGQLDMLTKIDPLYLFLPQITKLASKQFRTIQDICSTCEAHLADETGGTEVHFERALTPDINWESICDTKQVDQDLYIRYSEPKTLLWLQGKLDQLLIALKPTLAAPSKATLMSYSLDLLGLYLSPKLSESFKKSAKFDILR